MTSKGALGVLSVFAAVRGVLTASNTSATDSSLITAYLENGYLDLGIASDAYAKAKAFVSPLSNTEKISIVIASSFTSSNASWSAYANSDGVDGLNFYYYVSAFAMTNALTQTWDRDLFAAHFKAVGEEYFKVGLNVVDGALLGPLGRVPEGGRQNEAFTPDPYLAGVAVAEGVKGQQDAGVIAGVRHFLLYEQETNRMGGGGGGGFGGSGPGGSNSSGSGGFGGGLPSSAAKRQSSSDLSTTSNDAYSSNADDKTLHEVYMWPWADAIQAGAMAVMCAMPRVNDTYSCSNNALLEGKLKTELGFPGFVYPDEQAQKTAYDDANAGLDYSPYSNGLWTEETLSAGLANGSLSQARLDDMATRTVLPYYFVGLDTADQAAESNDYTAWRDVRGNHSALIRKIGAESIALLKNDNAHGGGLPLNKPHSISLYGAHAGPAVGGPNYGWSVGGTSADVFQGHLASGGGSGQVSLPYLITPYLALTLRAVEDNSQIFYIMNNTYTSDSSGMGGLASSLAQGTGVYISFDNYASASDVCLCFINSWSGEGADRSSLFDSEQDDMITTVASSCNNTIVVVNVSGPRILDAWIDNENVTAVIYSGLLGQESGYAIADVLYGDVNPSGKLIHTVAKNESDYPASTCEDTECSFDEGVYVDYRWFDEQGIEPRYPFGHGLSYTSFTYGAVSASITNSTVLASKYPTGGLTLGGEADLFVETVTVTTSITNSGPLSGAEVAQLYVTFPEVASQPSRVLRGFEKVNIDAGATASGVTFALRRRDLSYWDVAAQKWALAEGTYTFAVGSSSRDIRGNATLDITIG